MRNALQRPRSLPDLAVLYVRIATPVEVMLGVALVFYYGQAFGAAKAFRMFRIPDPMVSTVGPADGVAADILQLAYRSMYITIALLIVGAMIMFLEERAKLYLRRVRP